MQAMPNIMGKGDKIIKRLIKIKGDKKMMKDYAKIAEAVGELLREARQRAGFSRKQLAKMSGVSRNQIYNVEQGSVRVTAELLDMLCEALNVKLKEVLKPYEDKRYMHKNKQQSLQPKALSGDRDSQSPQDTQEEKYFKPIGLAGGYKSAKIKLQFIKLQFHLYYAKAMMNV